MRLPLLASMSLALIGMQLASPDPASACTLAVEYAVTVEQSDLPECATLEDGASIGEAAVVLSNDCDGELRLEALECETCQEPMTLRPGAVDREFVVETREEASRPRLAWTLNDSTGEVLLDVALAEGADDDENVCGGCRLGGAPGSGLGALSLVLLGLGLGGRRRRSF